MQIVGFIIRIYDDARSPERQIRKVFYLPLSRLYSKTLNIQACNITVFFVGVKIGLLIPTSVTSIGHV